MKRTGEPQPHRIATSGPVRLVQITDSHIFAGVDDTLWGMNTRRSFEAVKADIVADGTGYDLILATGDLAQDGSADAYRYLAGQFGEFGAPTFWLPGNHDEIDTMTRNFVGEHIHPAKQVLAGNWLILLLDSTVAGEVHGRVSESQLEFMDESLQRHQDRHALVCLHHQARQSGSDWIDAKGLLDAETLRTRIARHDNVRAVSWGHVHQESHRVVDAVEWMSTPSSCVQFKPGSREFALGDELPGYRRLRLDADGSLQTAVCRVRL